MTISPFARGHLAMLLFSFLVAGSFSFGTRIAHLMEPAAMMAVRFVISGVLVGALAHFTVGFKRIHWRAPWRYILLGGLFAIYFGLMFEGLKTAAPVSASAVFTLTPIMSAGFGYLFLGQITTRWMWLSLLIGGIGALWVIFNADIGAVVQFDIGRGEQVFFVGCIAHAAYTPLVRKLNRGEPTVVFTFGMIVAAMVILASVGARDLASTQWTTLPSYFWAGLFYLAVCASAMTFMLLQYASMQLPSANVMAYTYLTPSWVILWELYITKSTPDIGVLIGVFATIVALFMLLRR
ncbi:hypothetical protein GCM10008927_24350 [Amylibacter ulvae]|uniref:EamA domain-containing protein n=1 Tax=Paramylibacter ulvae TaxID=1651968 RepID=A0ABQ3D844_9RHOB|nr:DMT family transporter [Amylibacter ulvae]GHA57702.1 hypothetical protein GCM10008927_24350 [Amylibacter ulvae]